MRRMFIIALGLACATGLRLGAGEAMLRAIKTMDLNQVKARLAAGDPINERARDTGWTPLHWAVFYEQAPIARYLLQQGADPNIQATAPFRRIKTGATPLIIAGYYGMDDMAELLLGAGARQDFTDQSGASALDYARKYHFTPVVALLEKAAQPAPPKPAAPPQAAPVPVPAP